MKKAIVTGFEPFGPYVDIGNPVQDLARECDGKKLGDIEVIGLIVPCTYHGAFKLLSEKIDELSPDIILSSGLASRVPRIRLEAIGRNIMNGKYPDADGKNPDNEPLVLGGKLWYQTSSNNIYLANTLHRCGIPSEISVDAEGFICNSLVYLTAKRISDERLPIQFAFFHTPWTEDYLKRISLEPGKTTIKKRDLINATEILVREMGRAS